MNINDIKTVSIVGAGSWGTTIAAVIAEQHPDMTVRMWAFEKNVTSSIKRIRENTQFLPGVKLPSNIFVTSNLKEAISDCSVIIIATPSKVVPETSQKIYKHIKGNAHIGYLSKGFCKINNQVMTISQTIEYNMPRLRDNIVAISGPSHAEEVSLKYHTCLNVGGKSAESRSIFIELLKTEYIQCRGSEDIIGVELGGTLKNPAAIAAGMISVLPGCGDNLAGALMSEALKEMIRLARIFRVKPETMVDISGLGDLVATALSSHSRNRRFGIDIASQINTKGKSLNFLDKVMLRFRPDYILEKMSRKLHYLAEGAYAIEPLIELAEAHGISIPVYRALYEVLLNKKNPSLLVETIKNPEKFDEIFSETKIQISEKKKGMENVHGRIFREIISKNVLKKYVGSSFNNMDFRENVIQNLKESVTPGRSESKLISMINRENYESKITELIKIYVHKISDRFNIFANRFFLRYIEFVSILNTLNKNRIFAYGNTAEVRRIKDSANIIYVSTFKSYYDFLVLLYIISINSLPMPRFLISKNAMKSGFVRRVLRLAGGFVVNYERMNNKLYRDSLSEYISTMIENGIPLLYFPEEKPSFSGAISETSDYFFDMIYDAMMKHTVEVALVPIEISYSFRPRIFKKVKISPKEKIINNGYVNISNPLKLSEFTKKPDCQKEIKLALSEIWKNDQIILPHYLVSKVLMVNGFSAKSSEFSKMAAETIEKNKINLIGWNDHSIQNGLDFLKKNRIITDDGEYINVINREDIKYFANIIQSNGDHSSTELI